MNAALIKKVIRNLPKIGVYQRFQRTKIEKGEIPIIILLPPIPSYPL